MEGGDVMKLIIEFLCMYKYCFTSEDAKMYLLYIFYFILKLLNISIKGIKNFKETIIEFQRNNQKW